MNISKHWHSVLDKAPDKDGCYLVCFNGESGFYAIMSFRKDKWWQGTHGEGIAWQPTGFLTHWREIPSVFDYE